MNKFDFSNIKSKLQLLSKEDIEKIHSSAIRILEKIGIMFDNKEALKIFNENGFEVIFEKKIVKINEEAIKEAIIKAPSKITIYDRNGKEALFLEENNVYYNPGSAAINILDIETNNIRKPISKDLEKFSIIVDSLPYIHAQSTALIVSDVPEIISDRYRLYIILKNAIKPIITGAFTIDGLHDMVKMLKVVTNNELSKKPIAIFDVCPSPPLMWSEITSQNLIDCAKYMVPAEIVPMPLSGATAPVTLAGTIVQHTAEALSGIVLSQIVNPGAPIIYGGSPAIFEMRYGTTPMGAIETIMIDCSYALIGKYYGLPTHSYLGLSDSKIVDIQAGFESSIGIILGALTGINVISGPGMIDFESCQSMEKLVIDNEICGMALRLIKRINVTEDSLAIELIEKIGPGGHFLTSKHTIEWLKREFFIPSEIIDRFERKIWIEKNHKNCIQRAKEIVEKILKENESKKLEKEKEKALDEIINNSFKKYGF
jgi:trimethylamine--corrinoid protein Co-methyltransferase